MLKDLAALGLESGGVTLLPFLRYVSSLENLNIELYKVNPLMPHTRINVQNLTQLIGIVRESDQNKLNVAKRWIFE